MKMKTWFYSTFLFVSLLIVMAGCSKSDPTNPMGSGIGGGGGGGSSPNTITMGNSSFNPQNLTIARGATVTWSNPSGIAHTSTSDNGTWDTGNIPAGGSKTTTFKTAGTFPYHCTYHQSMGMVGTITVN